MKAMVLPGNRGSLESPGSWPIASLLNHSSTSLHLGVFMRFFSTPGHIIL